MPGKERLRRKLMGILGEPACADCGVSEFLLLDIHHGKGDGAIDRSNLGRYWEKYYVDNPEEAKRAGSMVLCANCHRRRHRAGKLARLDEVIEPRKFPQRITIYLKPGSRVPTPEELGDFLTGLKSDGKK